MSTMNDFVGQDWQAMEIIFVEDLYRNHWFVMVRWQSLCLLELDTMMIDHRHINHHQQDLREVCRQYVDLNLYYRKLVLLRIHFHDDYAVFRHPNEMILFQMFIILLVFSGWCFESWKHLKNWEWAFEVINWRGLHFVANSNSIHCKQSLDPQDWNEAQCSKWCATAQATWKSTNDESTNTTTTTANTTETNQ